MNRRKVVSVVLVLLTCIAVAPGADDPAAPAYRTAYELILKQKWAEARAKFDDIIKRYPRSPYSEDSRYWICHTRWRLGEPPADIHACFLNFIEKYPHNKFTAQARSNLVELSMVRRVTPRGDGSVPFVPMRTTAGEDARLAGIFALQLIDSNAALQEVIRLCDTSTNAPFRAKLVYVLGSFRTSGAIRKLGQIVRTDPLGTIRTDAISLLGITKTTVAYDELRTIVDSPIELALRRRALGMLTDADVPGIDTLLFRLATGERDLGLSEIAAVGLSRLSGERNSEMLWHLFRRGRTPSIRQTGFFSLVGSSRRLIPPSALKKLATGDPDQIIRICAATLSEMRGDSLEAALAMIDILTMSGRRSGESILVLLPSKMDDEAQRGLFVGSAMAAPAEKIAKIALYGMEKLWHAKGGPQFALVARYSKHPAVRLAALDRIAGLQAVTPVVDLSEILKRADDPGIRLSTIRALAVQKNDSVVAVLLEAAEAAADPAIRTAAINGLKSLGTPKAHDALKALEEEE